MIKKHKKNNQHIEIRGARLHNLKNISIKIPKNKLIVKHLKRTKSILKRKEQKLASNMKKMFA